jgi:hypothetical protein
MRRFAFVCCCVAVLGGCRKSENRTTADTTAAMVAPAAAPAALTAGDVAGKWNVRTTNEAGDSTLLVYVLTATPDPTGWTVAFPNRAPIAVHVIVAGDSIITDAGPYPSVLRKGVQVTTHGVSRLQGGKLVGTTVAHYATSRPDSVRTLRTEGTRAQ